MSHLKLLAEALEYIEQHIQDDIHTEDIAEACYCSKSTLEKLFRNVNHISVRDYMIRRRMTLAARTLVEQPKLSVLDVALMYGYSSHEAFTRAFLQVWNCLPSKYRENMRVMELFPRLMVPVETGDDLMSLRRKFDIGELYDLFQERKNCYFVCGDIKRLVPINEISHKAGDLAILTAFERMEDAAGEDDIVFRIGGDEFAMLTSHTDEEYATAVAEKIRAKNGEPIVFEGKEIPLSLYVDTVVLGDKTKHYDELFTVLQNKIRQVQAAENK